MCPTQPRGRWHAADLPSGRVARRRPIWDGVLYLKTAQTIPPTWWYMTTVLSRRWVPTVSRTNTQLFSAISRGLNRSQDLSLRYIVVSDRLVITLCMSRFDELSFASTLTRSVLAAASPEIEPTVITITMSTNRRRMASPSPVQPRTKRWVRPVCWSLSFPAPALLLYPGAPSNETQGPPLSVLRSVERRPFQAVSLSFGSCRSLDLEEPGRELTTPPTIQAVSESRRSRGVFEVSRPPPVEKPPRFGAHTDHA